MSSALAKSEHRGPASGVVDHPVHPALAPALRAEAGRLAVKGLLAGQLFVGYEWFMSGLTKLWRGGFPSGLAGELRDKSEGAVGWYKSFLDGSVIPNASAFGVAIEVGELVIGVALIATAITWLVRGSKLTLRTHTLMLWATALAAFGAIVMNVNFHLANGSPHPWLIPKSGFDEGIDLDSLLPLVQLVLLAVSGRLLVILRRTRNDASDDGRAAAA